MIWYKERAGNENGEVGVGATGAPEVQERTNGEQRRGKSWVDKLVDGALDVIGGTGETAATLATGAVAYPLAKVGGALYAPTQMGNKEWGARTQEVENAIADMLTYKPRTKSGRASSNVLSKAIAIPFKPAEMAGELVSKYDPNLGYVIKTAGEYGTLMALPGVQRNAIKGAKAVAKDPIWRDQGGYVRGPKAKRWGKAPVVVERRGSSDGKFYAPFGESEMSYGDNVTVKYVDPKAKIYSSENGAIDYVMKKVNPMESDPILDEFGIKNWKEFFDDWGNFDIGNDRYREGPTGPTGLNFYIAQKKAEQLLSEKGYQGAEWRGEPDMLNPHQWHIWDKTALQDVNTVDGGNRYSSLVDGMERERVSDYKAKTRNVKDLPAKFQEIDLASGERLPAKYRLDEVYDHPELYEDYPQIAETPVSLVPGTERSGWYDPPDRSIGIVYDARTGNVPKDLVAHEVHHRISHEEGRPAGSSEDLFQEEYKRKVRDTAAEIDARIGEISKEIDKEHDAQETMVGNGDHTKGTDEWFKSLQKMQDLFTEWSELVDGKFEAIKDIEKPFESYWKTADEVEARGQMAQSQMPRSRLAHEDAYGDEPYAADDMRIVDWNGEIVRSKGKTERPITDELLDKYGIADLEYGHASFMGNKGELISAPTFNSVDANGHFWSHDDLRSNLHNGMVSNLHDAQIKENLIRVRTDPDVMNISVYQGQSITGQQWRSIMEYIEDNPGAVVNWDVLQENGKVVSTGNFDGGMSETRIGGEKLRLEMALKVNKEGQKMYYKDKPKAPSDEMLGAVQGVNEWHARKYEQLMKQYEEALNKWKESGYQDETSHKTMKSIQLQRKELRKFWDKKVEEARKIK